MPIFFPAWWPHTWYNTRYGLELLPALALGLGFAAQLIIDAIRSSIFAARAAFPQPLAHPAAPAERRLHCTLCALRPQCLALLREDPLVYVESTKNLDARLPYDHAIPPFLQQLLAIFRTRPY